MDITRESRVRMTPVVLLALLKDAMLAQALLGEVSMGDGWMMMLAPCRTAASLPFTAELNWLLNTREEASLALRKAFRCCCSVKESLNHLPL